MGLSLGLTRGMRLWCNMSTSQILIMCYHLGPTTPTSLSHSWQFHADGYGLYGKNTKKSHRDYSVDSHCYQFWSLFMCFLMGTILENAPGLISSKHDIWWWWLWLLPLYTRLYWLLFCFSWVKGGRLQDNLSDAMTSLTLRSWWGPFTCATVRSMYPLASQQCISSLM